MASLNELKEIALSLPETIEGTHFHLLAYKVLDKPFIGLDKTKTTVMLSLDKPNIQKFVAENPGVFKEVWQTGKYLIGISFKLDSVWAEQLQQLVELSWKNKAPKKLVKEFGR
jgi:hypothetical protein